MTFLTKFSIKNPVAVIILIALVTVGGLYASTKFKQEQMPDISIPYLFVTAVYPGATPQEVQNEVTIPLENALKNIEGLEVIESTSGSNIATINLQFPFNADMKEKESLVEEALNGVDLPDDVERPKINKISSASGPMMYTAVTAQNGTDFAELNRIVKQEIKPALEGLDGVGKVQTLGMLSDNIYIKMDAQKLKHYNLTFSQVYQTFQAMHLTLPLGEHQFEKVKQPIMVTGKMRTVEEIRNLVLVPYPEVRLSDVATVTVGNDSVDTISRVQGEPSIAVNIIKNSDANTIEVSERVMEKLRAFTDHNDKIRLDVIYDAANDIRKSISGMVREGLLGALFASVLILLFLRNLRATIIAIVSIPLSILVSLSLMKYFTDITLNIMTLGGMAVATGRVVDDSIVVIENIVRRIQNVQVTREVILDATKEVTSAITSSTLTTVAVFAPLGLVGGLVGKIFAPFALTVVFSLLASLLVAVTVVPMLAFLLMRKAKPKEHEDSRLAAKYRKVLLWSLNHKAFVLIVAFALFLGSLVLPAFTGTAFIPEQEEKFIMMTLEMEKGTPVQTVDATVQQIDRKLRDTGHVLVSQVTSGSPEGEFDPFTMSSGESHKATWLVSMTPDTDIQAFIDTYKDKLKPDIDGATLDMQDLNNNTGGPAINIIITGDNKENIRTATEMIMEAVKKVEGTDNIKNTLKDELTSVEIKVRPFDALRNGLTTAQAYQLLRPIVDAVKVGKIGDGTRTDDIYMTLEGVTPQSVKQIESYTVTNPMGQVIAVKEFADVRETVQPSVLQLRDGQEYATITGNITSKDQGRVNADIQKALSALQLPSGVSYQLDGSNKQIEDMMKDMMMAIVVAVGMVYVVMVVAFGEGRAPFVILFSLPFALIGAFLGTLIAGQPISIASMIGILMLIGIVVTNAIVLVDRVQQQIQQGAAIREALMEAGGTRLRPILMTAIATICALMPLALGMGEGAIISQGLAVVVIGGLVTSTLLTLIIVPVMYEILHFRTSRKQRQAATSSTSIGM